jgi:hypothetical protein
MTAVSLENHLQLAPPRPALHPVAHPATTAEELDYLNGDFQPWEIHSELVLVDPELRRRSLELLPEIDLDAAPARSPRLILHSPLVHVEAPPPILLSPLAPTASAAVPAPVREEPAVESIGILRYAVHRVVDITRFGLAIIGTIFVLAMLADAIAR